MIRFLINYVAGVIRKQHFVKKKDAQSLPLWHLYDDKYTKPKERKTHEQLKEDRMNFVWCDWPQLLQLSTEIGRGGLVWCS